MKNPVSFDKEKHYKHLSLPEQLIVKIAVKTYKITPLIVEDTNGNICISNETIKRIDDLLFPKFEIVEGDEEEVIDENGNPIKLTLRLKKK